MEEHRSVTEIEMGPELANFKALLKRKRDFLAATHDLGGLLSIVSGYVLIAPDLEEKGQISLPDKKAITLSSPFVQALNKIIRAIRTSAVSSRESSGEETALLEAVIEGGKENKERVIGFLREVSEEAVRKKEGFSQDRFKEYEKGEDDCLTIVVQEINYYCQRIIQELKNSMSENKIVLLILRKTRKIMEFAQEVRDFFNLDELKANFESINIDSFLREIIKDFEGANQGHPLKLDIDPTLSSAWVDPRFLRRILTNFISNAIKYSYSDEDKEPINIRAVFDEEKGEWQISVQDFGIGLNPETLKKIRAFTPGMRTKEAKEHASGTGFGLYFSYCLAAKMGARIEVDSPGLGKGSTFTLILPHKVSSD